jgi:hypothetical protein
MHVAGPACEIDHRLFLSLHQNIHTTLRYLQPPFVTMCVSGHCAPQTRFSYATIWGAYDMWMFRGSRAWSQWGVVRRFHVLLACRKFWFCYVVCPLLPPAPGSAAEWNQKWLHPYKAVSLVVRAYFHQENSPVMSREGWAIQLSFATLLSDRGVGQFLGLPVNHRIRRHAWPRNGSDAPCLTIDTVDTLCGRS